MSESSSKTRDRLAAAKGRGAVASHETQKAAAEAAETAAVEPRKRRVARERFTTRLPVDVVDAFDAACDEGGFAKQDALERAVRLWLAEVGRPFED